LTEPSDIPLTAEGPLPKFPAPPAVQSSPIGRSLLSLLLYLFAGYWLLGDLENLLLITFVLLLHEGGHFVAMRQVGYRDLGVFFLPLLGAYVSGSKRVVTQRESAIVLLAGPLPGMLLGATLYFLMKNGMIASTGLLNINLKNLMLFLVVLNGLNLLPVYPLDGGQLLNRVFLDEEGWASKLFVLLSAAFMSYLAIQYQLYLLLIFPIGLLFRLWKSAASQRVDKRITASGIETEIDYEDLSDIDYWRIRRILIEENKSIQALAGEHLETYAPAEAQIQQAVEAQLHRTLIQDLSVLAKIGILFLWVASIAFPLWIWLG
jgi:Zn-dependent protease